MVGYRSGPKGAVTLSASLKNGAFDGGYESWWDDGKLKEQGEFKDGVRQPGTVGIASTALCGEKL